MENTMPLAMGFPLNVVETAACEIPKGNKLAGQTARMEGNSYFLVNPDDTTKPMILRRVFANKVKSHFSTYKKINLLTSCDTIGFLKTLID
jgi:hypothetical protein